MKTKVITLIISIIIFISGVALGIYASTYPFNDVKEPLIWTKDHRVKEKEYVKAYCKGEIEYRLPDKTRIDCLTDEYAIEFDFAPKWAESIGQSLYYAKMTGRKPAVAIICKSPKDKRYIERLHKAHGDIKVYVIRAYAEKKDK